MKSQMLLCGVWSAVVAGPSLVRAGELTETEYFNELPIVLTASRLAQPLNEVPGAVTVIDRDTLRRSGARELADVMRLVPGYLVGGINGANPVAAYHVPIDLIGGRNLVLIDGRPVYSGYYLGDTHRGMMGVLLEDIERIEVLRGSNSAAYGANAMFGVINIITRHTLDTQGGEVSMTGGAGGVQDNMARIGWGNGDASFRLSAGRRSDSGLRNAYDDLVVSQAHFRGDVRLASDQELMLATGVSQIATGEGFTGVPGNPIRTIEYRDAYLHGQWRRQLSSTDELKLTANFDEEHLQDAYPHEGFPGITVSTSGRGRRINLEAQHQVGIFAGLRAVWGAGYKYEDALSPPLYGKADAVSFHEERLFGSVEWRPHPQWLINAGGFWGNHSWSGNYFSPRLMVNFEPRPGHTLRVGVTESSRTPALFELASDLYFRYPLLSRDPIRYFLSSGTLSAEKLQSQEVGYFGRLAGGRLTVDLRAYVESAKDTIDKTTCSRPECANPSAVPFITLPNAKEFVNYPAFKTYGVEYQVRWKLLADTDIWLNQNFQQIRVPPAQPSDQFGLPPTHATTLAIFQRLPAEFDLSLIYQTIGAMSWGSARDTLPSRHRLDVRLAKSFRMGSTRAEAALTVQAANGAYPEYLTRRDFSMERRTFGTLRLSF